MKKLRVLAVLTAIAVHASSSMAATTRVEQNVGEQYTYAPDQDLIATLSPLRTGFYDQNINLPEFNEGDPLAARPQIMIFTTQPYTGLYPFDADPFGKTVEPLSIHTTGGQGPGQTQGEAHLMVRLTISQKADSELELPGKRLLITKGEFTVKTDLGHSRPDSQVYVSVYCGSKLLNELSSNTIRIPAGTETTLVTPQAQINDFDFANCREDVNVYYVADAQNIQFKSLTWMITKGTNTPAPVDNPSEVRSCQYKHKAPSLGGSVGRVTTRDAFGRSRTCDSNGNWKMTCNDNSGKTDEVGCR
ncbi:hypothetical protein [Oligoflexus tunisiensis]|uniref:hypothetical protein n=1 Tax=Oligoflexus tunisiensis TaxID=708132 RepID=UPI00114D1EAF|nr:hypothetical protein [Oligoflexus tunisiensis]